MTLLYNVNLQPFVRLFSVTFAFVSRFYRRFGERCIRITRRLNDQTPYLFLRDCIFAQIISTDGGRRQQYCWICWLHRAKNTKA